MPFFVRRSIGSTKRQLSVESKTRQQLQRQQKLAHETLQSTSSLKRNRNSSAPPPTPNNASERQRHVSWKTPSTEESQTHQSLSNTGGRRIITMNVQDRDRAINDFQVPVWADARILELKLIIESVRPDISASEQRLFHDGKKLKDGRLLSDYYDPPLSEANPVVNILLRIVKEEDSPGIIPWLQQGGLSNNGRPPIAPPSRQTVDFDSYRLFDGSARR